MARKSKKEQNPDQEETTTLSLIEEVGGAIKDSNDAVILSLFGGTSPKPQKKGEAAAPVDKKKEINALTQRINAQFKGKAILRVGSEITNVFMLRRPTGITSLDLAIGGGIPAGGLTQIIGKNSSGKSWLSTRIMANAQQTYGDDFAASVNMTEQRYDKWFAKQHCGLRVAFSDAEIDVMQRINQEFGRPLYTEPQIQWLKDEVGSFVETLGTTAEDLLEAVCEQVESNLFQVVLVDSFGALLTKAEAEADEGLNQKHRGGAAAVITAFMHRLHAALNMPDKYGRPNMTSIIGINQYRDNLGAGLYGPAMKIAGGNALAHGKLLDIHVEQGAKIRVENGKEKVVVGKEIHWEITKGKAGCHDGQKGTYKFYFGENGNAFGADVYEDLIAAGLKAEVVEQSYAWYSWNGERIGQGAANAGAFLASHPDVLQQIRREIFRKAGLNFITKEGI